MLCKITNFILKHLKSGLGCTKITVLRAEIFIHFPAQENVN